MCYFMKSKCTLDQIKQLQAHLIESLTHRSKHRSDSGATFDREQMNSDMIVLGCCLNRREKACTSVEINTMHAFFRLFPGILLYTTCQRDTCC